jgi:hypothetical protein
MTLVLTAAAEIVVLLLGLWLLFSLGTMGKRAEAAAAHAVGDEGTAEA